MVLAVLWIQPLNTDINHQEIVSVSPSGHSVNLVAFSPAFLTDPFRSVTTVFSITQVSSRSVSWTPGLISFFPAIVKKQWKENFKHHDIPRKSGSSDPYRAGGKTQNKIQMSTHFSLGALFVISCWNLFSVVHLKSTSCVLDKEHLVEGTEAHSV